MGLASDSYWACRRCKIIKSGSYWNRFIDNSKSKLGQKFYYCAKCGEYVELSPMKKPNSNDYYECRRCEKFMTGREWTPLMEEASPGWVFTGIKYSCPNCSSLSELTRISEYKCDNCGKIIKSDNTKECKYCSKEFCSEKCRDSHVYSDHKVFCEICGNKFIVSDGEDCNYCSTVLCKEKCVDEHEWNEHSFSCQICKEKTKQNKGSKCSYCGTELCSDECLDKHEWNVHSFNCPVCDDPVKEDKGVKCSFCSINFCKKPSCKENHEWNEHSYVCLYCKEKKLISEEKKCNYCNGSVCKTCYTGHVDEKHSYNCDICGKRKENNKGYECNYCSVYSCKGTHIESCQEIHFKNKHPVEWQKREEERRPIEVNFSSKCDKKAEWKLLSQMSDSLNQKIKMVHYKGDGRERYFSDCCFEVNDSTKLVVRLYLNHFKTLFDSQKKAPFYSITKFKELEDLSLSGCDLKELPINLKSLKSLKYLDLSNNQLSEIPLFLFSMENLEKINLTGNKISLINLKILKSKGKKIFILDKNQIKELPFTFNVLPNSLTLSLDDNPRNLLFYQNFSQTAATSLCNLDYELKCSFNITGIVFEDKKKSYGATFSISNTNTGDINYRNAEVWKIEIKNQNLNSLPNIIQDFKYLKELDLEANNLSILPERHILSSLSNLEKLNLKKNHFTQVPDTINVLISLKSLNLNNNELTNFQSAFSLMNLEELYLSSNMITDVCSELINMRMLKILDISNNKLKRLHFSKYSFSSDLEISLSDNSKYLSLYNDLLFKQADALISMLETYSDLKYTINNVNHQVKSILLTEDIKSLFEGIYNFSDLRALTVHSKIFSEIDKKVSLFPELERLDLSDCAIMIVPEILGFFKNLEYLNLSNNPIEKIEAPNCFSTGLKEIIMKECKLIHIPTMNCPFLKHLELTHNKIQEVPEFIETLKNLEKLNLEDNSIIRVSASLKNIRELKYLNLSQNQLEKLPFSKGEFPKIQTFNIANNKVDLNYFENLDSLEASILIELELDWGFKIKYIEVENHVHSLNLNGKNLTSLPKKLQNFQYLEKIFLMNNKFTKFPEPLIQISQLKIINLNSNRIQNFNEPYLNEIHKSNLEEIYLKNNNLDSFPIQLVKFSNLKKINLSENKINIIPESIRELKKLEVVRFNSCNLAEYPNVFINLSNLTHIYLNHNKIMQIEDVHINKSKIQHLEIANNELIKISDSFKDLRNLKYLDISNNKIKELGFCFNDLPSDFRWKCENNERDLTYYEILIPIEAKTLEDILLSNPDDIDNYKINNFHVEMILIKKIFKLSNLTNFQKTKSIHLSDGNIRNEIEHLMKFPYLEYLILEDIEFTEIPENIINLKKLRSLKIVNNPEINIIPPLPSTLTKLTLNQLALEEFPINILKLKNLRYLDLNENSIKDIPADLSKLSFLKKIQISHNSLEHIPRDLIKLTNLTNFDISNNNLRTLPFSKNDFVSNITMNVANNSGSLGIYLHLTNPSEISAYNEILVQVPKEERKNVKFEAENGHISRIFVKDKVIKIPLSFTELKWLKKIEFINTGLTEFPNIKKFFTMLNYLDLSNNYLIDLPPLPESITFLNISNNPEMEFIPKSLKSLIYLNELKINNCKINDLPPFIAKLENLKKIELNHNQIAEIPKTLSNSSIVQLQLNNNLISSLSQNCINLNAFGVLELENNQIIDLDFRDNQRTNLKLSGNARDLSYYKNLLINDAKFCSELVYITNSDIEYKTVNNQITELNLNDLEINSISSDLKNLSMLKKLTLNNCQFMTIPIEITDCKQLESLEMKNNKISFIGDNIKSLKNLINFDLSNNSINSISDSITGLKNLKYFALSNNPCSLSAQIDKWIKKNIKKNGLIFKN